MPTQAGGYYLDGKRIPSVTTILGNCGWNKDALMGWAHRQGLAGVENYRAVSGAAADAGTIAHAKIEAHIHGEKYMPPADVSFDVLAKAEEAFGAALRWLEDTQLEVVATEIALISPTLRVGGTADALMVRRRTAFVLPDWKTSGGTYADHLMQLAAYGALFEETTGWQLDGGFYSNRFDKESGGFSVKWWPRAVVMDKPLTAFRNLRELHDLRYPLQKLCA